MIFKLQHRQAGEEQVRSWLELEWIASFLACKHQWVDIVGYVVPTYLLEKWNLRGAGIAFVLRL